MAAMMNAATFMGKNFSTKQNFHHEFQRSHFEANVRHHSKLVDEQEEINNVDKIHWENIHGNICH